MGEVNRQRNAYAAAGRSKNSLCVGVRIAERWMNDRLPTMLKSAARVPSPILLSANASASNCEKLLVCLGVVILLLLRSSVGRIAGIEDMIQLYRRYSGTISSSSLTINSPSR